MNNDIVNKSFYISSLFSDIKSGHNWTANEVKTVLLLLSEISQYRLYISKKELKKYEDKDIKNIVKTIPNKYTFSKDTFINITGIRRDNVAREINKIRKKLVSKVVHLPHPLRPNNEKSGLSAAWFSHIEYDDITGDFIIYVNNIILERLIAFIHYTNVNFKYLANIKNGNSIFTYIFIKALIDANNLKQITIELSNYKEKLGLKNKYRNLSEFRTRVLNVIKYEINQFSDINIDYYLIKNGRAFTKINFKFGYKNKVVHKNDIKDIVHNNITYLFEKIFTEWGLKNSKIRQIEDTYSLSAIKMAIHITQDAIEQNIIKSTPIAYFLGTLENKQIQENIKFKQEQEQLLRLQEKDYENYLMNEYNAVQKIINDNSEQISNYLSVKSAGGSYNLPVKLYDQLANIVCIDIEKYQNIKTKFTVLELGYFDMKQEKKIRPNMYTFLTILKSYIK